MNGNNYLLAIAIDNYQHLNKLNNAVKDIQEIVGVLTNLYQFEEEKVYKLFNEDATEDGIDEIFSHLIDQVTDQDNLLIFYSGHGHYRENVREGYWIPVDGRPNKASDYISNANLIRYLQNIKAHHVLMIIDSCFSGSLVEQLRGDTRSEEFSSRRVFASGRTELVSDGFPGENSPFAKGIIDFLKSTAQKQISTSSLIDSVRTYVGQNSPQDPVEGRLRDARENRGEFFFKRKLTEKEFWDMCQQAHHKNAYEEYLQLYPDGRYMLDAKKQLEALKAERAWRRAVTTNTKEAYNRFILAYPLSEYVDLAHRAKEELRIRDKKISSALTEQEEDERAIEEAKHEYRRLATSAEEDIRRGEYRSARKKLNACQRLHRKGVHGFIPSLHVLQERKVECDRKIDLFTYLEDADNAWKRGSIETAIKLLEYAEQLEPEHAAVEKRKQIFYGLSRTRGASPKSLIQILGKRPYIHPYSPEPSPSPPIPPEEPGERKPFKLSGLFLILVILYLIILFWLKSPA